VHPRRHDDQSPDSRASDESKKYDVVSLKLAAPLGISRGFLFLEAFGSSFLERGRRMSSHPRTLVPYIKSSGELKTKPAPSVANCAKSGLQPQVPDFPAPKITARFGCAENFPMFPGSVSEKAVIERAWRTPSRSAAAATTLKAWTIGCDLWHLDSRAGSDRTGGDFREESFTTRRIRSRSRGSKYIDLQTPTRASTNRFTHAAASRIGASLEYWSMPTWRTVQRRNSKISPGVPDPSYLGSSGSKEK